MLGRSSHGAACSPRAADVCRVTAAASLARRASRDGQGALASGGHPGWGTTTATAARVSRRVTRTRHCVSPVIYRTYAVGVFVGGLAGRVPVGCPAKILSF